MVTRKTLGWLAGATLLLFVVGAGLGDDRDGALKYIAKVSWFSFLACALILVVASIATLVRHGVRAGRS